jgi:alpha-D-ribose 1-methylphosphonate 5-triphosphate synthase subunit PhnH
MVPQLPGFQDPVQQAQQTFRALLEALARPGMPQAPAAVTPPAGLRPSCAAACLTLLDLETTLWIQPGLAPEVQAWLLFHTGCHLTEKPEQADFALIWDLETAPRLDHFQWGSPEYPEASTSLLVQCPDPDASSGLPVTLQGPGIRQALRVAWPLPMDFWEQWQQMTAQYPLGVDVWICTKTQVWGLPRTTQCQLPLAQETGP